MTLKEFRRENNLSQRELARSLGCSQTQIKTVECGEANPSKWVRDAFWEKYPEAEVIEMDTVRDTKRRAYKKRTKPKVLPGSPTDIAYENLAIAIINQAKLDYDSLKRRPAKLRTKEDKRELDDLRRFFRSEWFDLLCMQADSQVIRKEIGIK